MGYWVSFAIILSSLIEPASLFASFQDRIITAGNNLGLESIKNLQAGTTTGAIKVQFDGGEVTTFLTLTGTRVRPAGNQALPIGETLWAAM